MVGSDACNSATKKHELKHETQGANARKANPNICGTQLHAGTHHLEYQTSWLIQIAFCRGATASTPAAQALRSDTSTTEELPKVVQISAMTVTVSVNRCESVSPSFSFRKFWG